MSNIITEKWSEILKQDIQKKIETIHQTLNQRKSSLFEEIDNYYNNKNGEIQQALEQLKLYKNHKNQAKQIFGEDAVKQISPIDEKIRDVEFYLKSVKLNLFLDDTSLIQQIDKLGYFETSESHNKQTKPAKKIQANDYLMPNTAGTEGQQQVKQLLLLRHNYESIDPPELDEYYMEMSNNNTPTTTLPYLVTSLNNNTPTTTITTPTTTTTITTPTTTLPYFVINNNTTTTPTTPPPTNTPTTTTTTTTNNNNDDDDDDNIVINYEDTTVDYFSSTTTTSYNKPTIIIPPNNTSNKPTVRPKPIISTKMDRQELSYDDVLYNNDNNNNNNNDIINKNRSKTVKRGLYKNKSTAESLKNLPILDSLGLEKFTRRPTLSRSQTFQSAINQDDQFEANDETAKKQISPRKCSDVPIVDVPEEASCRKGSGIGELCKPKCIAIHPDTGNIYIVEKGNNRVQVFNIKLQYLFQFGGNKGVNKMDYPYGICFLKDKVYVTQSAQHCINVYTVDGEFMMQRGKEGSSEGLFSLPSGIGSDPHRNKIYVCDTGNDRVQALDMNLTPLRQIGVNLLVKPIDINITGTGELVVLDRNKFYLHFFSPDGKHQGDLIKGIHYPKLCNPLFFTVTNDNNYILSDYSNNCLFLFDKQGKQLDVIGEPTTKCTFNEPRGIVCDKRNRVIVVSADTENCLQIFKL